MKDIEVISNIKTIRVKMFTHNDLDGVSCALVLKKLYDQKFITFNFEFISYNDYDKIKNFFNIHNENGAKLYDYVFITDLNFKSNDYMENIFYPLKEYFMELNNPNNMYSSLFKKIFFIDHHKDSENFFRDKEFNIFERIEYFNDMTYCASLQLFNFIINNQSSEWSNITNGCQRKLFEDRVLWMKSYLNNVHDWDTFNWKNNNNLTAKDLNILFTHITRGKFFIMQEQKEGLSFYFNKTEKSIINEAYKQLNQEYVKMLNTSVVLDHIDEENFVHPDIQYIVVRTDENISLLSDMLKDDILNKRIYKIFNIKYMVNVSFKYGTLNFRRFYNDIDLAKIANIYGGGGHEFAAGCVLDGKNQLQLSRFILPTVEKYVENLNN